MLHGLYLPGPGAGRIKAEEHVSGGCLSSGLGNMCIRAKKILLSLRTDLPGGQ